MRKLNNRLLLNGCEFKIVKSASSDYLIRVEQYTHLSNEPMGGHILKALIEVSRYTMDKKTLWTKPIGKPQSMGFLSSKDPVAFVSVHDDYQRNRAVFYSNSGLAAANNWLLNTERSDLYEGINQMLRQLEKLENDET